MKIPGIKLVYFKYEMKLSYIWELAEMPTCLLIQAVNPHDTFHQADTNS